jgi:hypothetical protein
LAAKPPPPPATTVDVPIPEIPVDVSDGVPQHPNSAPPGDQVVVTPADAQRLQQVAGSAEAAARIHGCTKVSFDALGAVLKGLGADKRTQGNTAWNMYRSPQNARALGVANYAARVPEALFASTSATAKQFDILVAAAQEIVTANEPLPACPSVKLLDDNKLTKDGISCLLGKPAQDQHVALANDLIAQKGEAGRSTGQALAIAALLEAAHTCE